MSKADTLKAIRPITVMYRDTLDAEKLEGYVMMLGDYPPAILHKAVIKTIQESEFLPTVAAIRKNADKLNRFVKAEKDELTAQEAWELVRRKAGSVGYERGLNELQGNVLIAAKTIWSSFDPQNGKDYNETSCRSQFIKCYEQLTERKAKNDELAYLIKDDGLLLAEKMKNEEERKQIEAGNAKIKMLPNGHLIETVKEERKPVNLNEILDNADISDKGKALLRSAIGG